MYEQLVENTAMLLKEAHSFAKKNLEFTDSISFLYLENKVILQHNVMFLFPQKLKVAWVEICDKKMDDIMVLVPRKLMFRKVKC